MRVDFISLNANLIKFIEEVNPLFVDANCL